MIDDAGSTLPTAPVMRFCDQVERIMARAPEEIRRDVRAAFERMLDEVGQPAHRPYETKVLP